MPSWQQDIPLSSDVKARIGIGWANRNATSAVANHLAVRESITVSIRPNQTKASVRNLKGGKLGFSAKEAKGLRR
jgi:hypothetical protein